MDSRLFYKYINEIIMRESTSGYLDSIIQLIWVVAIPLLLVELYLLYIIFSPLVKKQGRIFFFALASIFIHLLFLSYLNVYTPKVYSAPINYQEKAKITVDTKIRRSPQEPSVKENNKKYHMNKIYPQGGMVLLQGLKDLPNPKRKIARRPVAMPQPKSNEKRKNPKPSEEKVKKKTIKNKPDPDPGPVAKTDKKPDEKKTPKENNPLNTSQWPSENKIAKESASGMPVKKDHSDSKSLTGSPLAFKHKQELNDPILPSLEEKIDRTPLKTVRKKRVKHRNNNKSTQDKVVFKKPGSGKKKETGPSTVGEPEKGLYEG
ncbi:MAG: hypothetical protein OEZ36_13650, partial [Spirochaetota bacterium]|nr:hypothetical protein [Spirochaetota bacterium]